MTTDEVEITVAVRQAIYAVVVSSGDVPDIATLAAATGYPDAIVHSALEKLAEAHVIVLSGDHRSIRFAPPFAAAGTIGFRVTSQGRAYAAPCAWDSFGIPAALHADAEIHASCAQSGVPIRCGVRGGQVYGDGLIHLLVPAAHFWDDIAYT
jgi:hypothetical protein